MAYDPKIKVVKKEQFLKYQMLSSPVQKKLISLSEKFKCDAVSYMYQGHSGPARGKAFIDNAFQLKEGVDAKIVSCTNYGCSTFKSVKEIREYFVKKCAGDTCDYGETFQITANRDIFYPAKGNYTAEVLRETDQKKDNITDASNGVHRVKATTNMLIIEDQN